MVIVIKAKND